MVPCNPFSLAKAFMCVHKTLITEHVSSSFPLYPFFTPTSVWYIFFGHRKRSRYTKLTKLSLGIASHLIRCCFSHETKHTHTHRRIAVDVIVAFCSHFIPFWLALANHQLAYKLMFVNLFDVLSARAFYVSLSLDFFRKSLMVIDTEAILTMCALNSPFEHSI